MAQSTTQRTRSRKSVLDTEGAVVYSRPHKCLVDRCGKSFTRREHLKRHQLNHVSARWRCEGCSATFARKDLYRRHISINEACAGAASAQSTCTPQFLSQSSESPIGVSGTDLINLGNSGFPDLETQHSEAVYEAPITLSEADPLPWLDDIDDWKFQVTSNQSAFLNDSDLDWFWQDSLEAPEIATDSVVSPQSLRTSSFSWVHFRQEHDNDGSVPPPRYLQDSRSKLFISSPGNIPAPNCGFPLCDPLPQDRRVELLMDLRDIMNVNIRDPIFSSNGLSQGLHLYSREVATEYAFIHRELLSIHNPEDTRTAFLDVLGELPGPELVWAVISFGWAFMRSDNNHEFHLACQIQREIRSRVLAHPRLTSKPPLWLVQTLFLVLLFARYQGTSEEYGAASMFHGVLLEAVLRLERGQARQSKQSISARNSTAYRFAIWIEAESVRRLIVQTFVMDVKNALLFGGEPLMSFKDMMDLRIPGDTDAAWFAQNLSEWEAATSKLSAELTNSTPQSFVALLKDLWQSVTPSVNSDGRASGSITQMYGILSIARELARREDNVLLQKPGQMSTLATTVERSLTMWERAWRKSAIGSEIPWMLPTCTCLLQLARNTLFEISPVELQIVAGRDVIEGKRRGRADYESALRKIKSWAKHQRGRQGVARAAQIIQSRLSGEDVKKHCQHCMWTVYLAVLVCWNYEFATTKSIPPATFIRDSRLQSRQAALDQSQTYLRAATAIPEQTTSDPTALSTLPSTTGMLVMVTQYLEDCFNIGMIQEAIELLRRLTGVRN